MISGRHRAQSPSSPSRRNALRLRRQRAHSVCALSALLVAASPACQIPVFRYALERWEPAPYSLTIAPGPAGLSPDERALVESLRNPGMPANLECEITAPATKSTLTLHYPLKQGQESRQPIWQVALSRENAVMLVDSPLRRQLRERLLSGQTAVWVLLESGDTASDENAAGTLRESLQAAQERLKLPDGVMAQNGLTQPSTSQRHESADMLQSDLPLKIEFSLLRLSRSNRAESALLSMLMHVEPDLGDHVHQPMAFPVFGRGRVLEPLIGKGIHRDNILETAGYLCGACSCEIKDQNPGIDLLLAADWEPVDNAPVVETVRIEPAAPAASAPTASDQTGRHATWGGIAASLALAVWFLLRKATTN